MTSQATRWDKVQKPEQRSKYHGKRDNGHGPHEHGLGGKRDPKPHGGTPESETPTGTTDSGTGGVGPESAASVAAGPFPSYFYVASTPPVTDQGTTPRCVAHSSAYDQNQHDRPELGRFNQMDAALFFTEIGGTADGAYMSNALARRRDVGYPERVSVAAAGGYPSQDANPNTDTHRIASFRAIPLTVDDLKAAFSTPGPDGKTHGVLMTVEWAHSWFHPFASGKLPAFDYEAGGHAIWLRGWNDSYGFRIRNSWGTDYGVSGDVFIPYANLTHVWGAWQTVDR